METKKLLEREETLVPTLCSVILFAHDVSPHYDLASKLCLYPLHKGMALTLIKNKDFYVVRFMF